MGSSSYVQSDFRGGAWSEAAQGAIADPKYKTAMSVSLNGYPTAPGSWVRRSGSLFCGTTRNGAAGRVISFHFKESAPYNIELTSGYMRFWAGPILANGVTNGAQAIASISTANPASVALSATMPSTWATGNSFMFTGLGVNNPLLQNRVFIGTKVDGTHVTIVDAVTGATIDGSTLGTFVSGSLTRVYELASPYLGTDWQAVQSVQTGKQAILLHGSYAPEILTVATDPTSTAFATFNLAKLTFLDGPYLDPPTNGAQLASSSQTGTTNLTVTYAAWSTTRAYKIGDLVLYSSVVYQALLNNNVNQQPDTATTYWLVVPAATGIGPNGFTSADIGRSVRLFSEPALWVSGASYTATTSVVSYPDSTGATAYWTCLTSHTAEAKFAPGTDLTHWAINPAGAVWTWGRVTGLLSLISGTVASVAHIGTLTTNTSAAFDGATEKVASSCASHAQTLSCALTLPVTFPAEYVGQDYHSTVATGYKILFGTLYPSSNSALIQLQGNGTFLAQMTVNMRGKTTSPSAASDGTLLGTVTVPQQQQTSSASVNYLGTSPITIVSSDTSTTYKYVWFEIIYTVVAEGNAQLITGTTFVAQAQFFGTSGDGSNGVSVELIGGNLLYSVNIRTWRIGLFTGTNSPKCGTWHEGRLWISGSVDNRIDGSVPNSIDPLQGTVNFAPTEKYGTVTDASAIDYTFDAPDINSIFWMQPDQQGIICGTQAGEWLVQATALNSPLTATNMQAHRVTKIGCANVLPRRAEHTLLFVQKHGRKIMEYFADIFSGKFSAPDLAEKAKHLTVSGILEIAYQQELTPILWARRTDGALVGMSYKRDTLMTSQGPTFTAWHEHTLGSGRTVESLCVGPSDAGNLDALAMVTNDTATNVRHVELMTDQFEEESALPTAWFLDDAVTPTSYATAYVMGGAPGLKINGLWHLNGKTVTVFVGGLDVGDWPVSSGSVQPAFSPSSQQTNTLFTAAFVSGYVGTLPIVVGFSYTSRGQLVRPDTQPESGARNGPGFAKKRRIHEYSARLVATQGIKFGTVFSKIKPAQLRTAGETPYAANALYTGTLTPTPLDDDYSNDGKLCWEISRPFPAMVAAAAGFIKTEDQ